MPPARASDSAIVIVAFYASPACGQQWSVDQDGLIRAVGLCWMHRSEPRLHRQDRPPPLDNLFKNKQVFGSLKVLLK